MFFLPLFDDNPTVLRPYVSWFILLACVLVYFWQISLGPEALRIATLQYGIVPALLFGHKTLPPEMQMVPAWLSIFTSMFLHGGWLHLASNMLYLWIFSDNVEVAMGKVRFVIFYACCGIAAALMQSLIDTNSVVPMIGASGGIAGILGAYLMLHPKAAVRVLIIILVFFRLISLPAWLILGVWILGQFVAAPQSLNAEGGVAHFAHIGGFLAGMALVPLFKYRHVPLFAGCKFAGRDATQEQHWSSTPISFRDFRAEAKERYSPRAPDTQSGSVPLFRRKHTPGPWG